MVQSRKSFLNHHSVFIHGGMMGKSTFTFRIHAVLRKYVTGFNPFISDMPVAGDNILVLNALHNAFVQTETVFSGYISDFVGMAEATDPTLAKRVRRGFEELEQHGYLVINGDIFIPTYKINDSCFTD